MNTNTQGNAGASEDRELQPGQTRETTTETKTPGTPEKDQVEKKVEHGPEIKHEER